MKSLCLLLLQLLICCTVATAQVKFTFRPVYADKEVIPGETYPDSTTITEFKFYASHLELLQNDSVVYSDPVPFHLINAEDPSSFTIQLNSVPETGFDAIRFGLGVDSLTCVSGAMGDDLDPVHGMYWAWQSGYINFKLEGRSPECSQPGHLFQYHLGGYSFPNNSYRTIKLSAKSASNLFLNLNLQMFLNHILPSGNGHIMSPGQPAMIMSDQLTKIFSITHL